MSKYFSEKELNPKGHPLDEAAKANLKILAQRLDIIREAFKEPMVITSGFRSRQDQERIYKHARRVPMGSLHLVGGAADVADRDGTLGSFVMSNIPLLERAELWIESPTATRGWVHFQTKPPKSGSRIFMP